MTQITRVITTLLAVVMLLSTTTPTYAAAASYENIATANCATETVEGFIDDASDAFTKLVEHIRWLRFDAYIRELLAKIKQEKNENIPTEPETPEDSKVPSEPEMPFEPVNPDNKVEGEEKEDLWVYPEDLMDAFESRIGYRPECQEVREPDGWSLEITLGSSEWTWNAKKSDYDGWRIKENEFEETFNVIIEDYFERVVDADSGEFLSTEEVEDLFEEYYEYSIDVYVCTYHTPEGVTADFVVCDRINGKEIEIDAIFTTKGWLIPEENWEWFIRNYDLEDESDYATSNIGWWDLDEILEEFQYMLGYVPEAEIWQDPGLDWYQTLDFTFEHLGGKEYSIEWLFLNGKGEPMVSDKVFEKFLEENPEITKLVDIRDEEELERMYAFYKARLESENE